MNPTLTQYDIVKAAHIVDGYFIPRPNESETAAFERARNEALAQLEMTMTFVQSLTLNQFKANTITR